MPRDLRTMSGDPLDDEAGGRGGVSESEERAERAREREGAAEGGDGDSVRAIAVVGDKLITGGTSETVNVYQ